MLQDKRLVYRTFPGDDVASFYGLVITSGDTFDVHRERRARFYRDTFICVSGLLANRFVQQYITRIQPRRQLTIYIIKSIDLDKPRTLFLLSILICPRH